MNGNRLAHEALQKLGEPKFKVWATLDSEKPKTIDAFAQFGDMLYDAYIKGRESVLSETQQLGAGTSWLNVAERLHYPEKWDTQKYPTLAAAMLGFIGDHAPSMGYLPELPEFDVVYNSYSTTALTRYGQSCFAAGRRVLSAGDPIGVSAPKTTQVDGMTYICVADIIDFVSES